MKVAQQPQKPPDGSNQNWATTSGKKDTASDSMYIATRRARLEAREAGFLVQNKSKIVWNGWYIILEVNTRKKPNKDQKFTDFLVKEGRIRVMKINNSMLKTDATMFLKILKFLLTTKSWKNHPQKLLRIPQIHFFSLLPWLPKRPKQKNSCSKMWPID